MGIAFSSVALISSALSLLARLKGLPLRDVGKERAGRREDSFHPHFSQAGAERKLPKANFLNAALAHRMPKVTHSLFYNVVSLT